MELGPRKKLHALSLAEKVQVLQLLDQSKLSQSEVARRFQVSQPQISRICKNKAKLLADWSSGTANRQRKRKRESKYSGVDEALLCWYRLARARAWDVTGPALMHKAKELADLLGQDFAPSVGWLVRWKRRNNVGLFGARPGLGPRCPPGPPPPRPRAQASPPPTLADFSPEDVFGCAQVPLLYRAVPGGRAATDDQVLVLLCANTRGTEKRRVVVSRLPRAPRGFLGASSETLPASYPQELGLPWSKWLAQFDRDMGRQGRQVALLLAASAQDKLAVGTRLCHVRVLPLAATSAPSLPSAVVRAFKAHYRLRLLGKLAALQSQNPDMSLAQAGARLTILDALHMAAAAWAKVTPQLIVGSFIQEGLAPGKMPLYLARASPMPPAPGGLSTEEFARFVDLEEEQPPSWVGKEESGTESEEGDLAEASPTPADALRALGTLRRWFECKGASPELFEKFYACEEEVERLCSL